MEECQEGHHPVYALERIWQLNNPLTVFCELRRFKRPSADEPKKIYLKIDASQELRGISLVAARNPQAKAEGAFAALMRKYLQKARLGKLLKDQEEGGLWLELWLGPDDEKPWQIYLSHEKPPQLLLINSQAISLIRLSQKGCYTKAKPLEETILLPTKSENPRFADASHLLSWQPKSELIEKKHPASDAEGKLTKSIRRRIKTLKQAQKKQELSLPDPIYLDELGHKAAWLKSNAYTLKAGITVVFPADLPSHITTAIDLNPKISIGENADALFRQQKKLKQALRMGEQRLEQIRSQIQELGQELEQGINEQSRTLLPRKIAQHANDDGKAKVKRIDFGKEYSFIIGRSAKENEEITRSAKANDYWFHAVSAQGAHVLLILHAGKGQRILTPAQKRQGCLLAIHYSKLREDLAGEVYFCQRRDLKKTKDLKLGAFKVMKSETLYVRYEDGELQHVLKGSDVDEKKS